MNVVCFILVFFFAENVDDCNVLNRFCIFSSVAQ